LESPNVQYAHPGRFAKVLGDFPHLRVVVAHLGLDFWEATTELAHSFENVFFDTSAALSGLIEPPPLSDSEARDLIRKIGPHKVLFASDFPWGVPAADLKRIQGLGLEDGELEAIVGKNAHRVLGEEG
jgi:predicted TIM-barrel fold metal-dependent hydrolase